MAVSSFSRIAGGLACSALLWMATTNCGQAEITDWHVERVTNHHPDWVNGIAQGQPYSLHDHQGELVYVSSDDGQLYDLWKLNASGDAARTFDLPFETHDSVYSMVSLAGTLYLLADAGYDNAVLRSAGSLSTFEVVRDVQNRTIANGLEISAVGGRLLFQHFGELYSAGPTGPMTMVHKINPDPQHWSFPRCFTPSGTRSYFVATIGTLCELWSTDGTDQGTAKVASLNMGTRWNNAYMRLIHPTSVTGVTSERVFFGMESPDQIQRLFTSKGTGIASMGTFKFAASDPDTFAACGPQLLFAAEADNGVQLFRTDGTKAGTRVVDDLDSPGGAYPFPFYGLTPVGGRVVFRHIGPGPRDEMWVTDGTAAGTRMLHAFGLNTELSASRKMGVMDGVLFFSATADSGKSALWTSDGEDVGYVTEIQPAYFSSSIGEFTPIHGVMYFTALDATHGVEIYRAIPRGVSRTVVIPAQDDMNTWLKSSKSLATKVHLAGRDADPRTLLLTFRERSAAETGRLASDVLTVDCPAPGKYLVDLEFSAGEVAAGRLPTLVRQEPATGAWLPVSTSAPIQTAFGESYVAGSHGVDVANGRAWAVLDGPGTFAVMGRTPLRVTGLVPHGGGGFQLSWSAEPGLLYQIEATDNLTDWQQMGAPLSGPAFDLSQLVTPSVKGRRFWRVRKLDP